MGGATACWTLRWVFIFFLQKKMAGLLLSILSDRQGASLDQFVAA
jgi:hypothetical protein